MMCFSDVFPWSLHRVQEFYTRYFNPITFRSVIKRLADSTTITTSEQADTATRQTNTTSG